MAAGLKSLLPVIEQVTRISKAYHPLFESGTHKFQEKRLIYADVNFLDFFSFPLVRGNANTALQNASGILITEDMATKYFGVENPIGKILKKDNTANYTVVGVLANIPPTSHLQFDFIIPMSAIELSENDLKEQTWQSFNYYSYLLLDDKADLSAAGLLKLDAAIEKIYKTHVPDFKVNFQLQAITSIHLNPDLQIDQPGHGNRQYVNIFFIVALFILAVACINFMNLSTARAARRAKEVGLRQVVGAERYQIIGQFLGEAIFICMIGFMIAIALVFILLPAFNEIANKQIQIQSLDKKFLLSLLALALITGLISGIYPAVYLSSFKPAKVLKGKMKAAGGNLIFRNTLVVTQFVVSIVLLIGTVVVYRQLQFIKNMNLGYEKRNLLYTHMTGELWTSQDALKTALKQDPLTSDFSIVSDLPTELVTGNIDVQWKGKDPRLQIIFPSMDVDEKFISLFQMKLLSGRSFNTSAKADSCSFIVNEKAAHTMGMTVSNAIGKQSHMPEEKEL